MTGPTQQATTSDWKAATRSSRRPADAAASTKAATARAMAVRMTLAVERNLRATDLVRHD